MTDEMTFRRFSLRMATVLGLALGVLILTLAMLTIARAQGPPASITIVKEADQMIVRGSSATFTIAVTNTGDVTLTNVTVSDAEAPDCDRTFAELQAGDHQSYVCAVTGVTDDFVNTATVTGTPPAGADVMYSDTASVDVIDPGIQIAKTPDLQTVVRGSAAAFTIAVTNTGDVTLTNVTVSDAEAPDCDRTFAELQAGGYQSYMCAVTGVADDFVNTATVTGTPSVGADVMDSDTASVDVLHPDIQIVKTPDLQWVARGSAVSFNVAITNTGEVTLTSVAVVDSVTSNCDNGFSELRVGECRRYTCEIPAVVDEFTSTITATGVSPVSEVVMDSDTATVLVLPVIEITKTPDEQTVPSGSMVNFGIAVTNTSDAVLTNVTVSDEESPDCDRTFAQLLAGEHRSYTCAVADVTDGFINSAIVTGTAPIGEDVTDADVAMVRLDETQTCPGDMLAYWRMDETSGATYDDYYYGHDGECAGRCPAPVSGHVGGGQAFNGYDTGIDVPVIPGDGSFNWGVYDSFSIELWMQTDSFSACSGSSEVMVGREDSATHLHWWTGCRDGGQAAFYLRDRGGTLAGVTGATDLTDGAWHHIVAVRDASADQILIFVDGVLEDSTPVTYGAGFDSTTAALNMGWLHRSHGYHFDGVVDEVAIYDQALSASDIQQHYNNGLVGRWYCQDGPFAPTIVSTPVTEAAAGRLYIYDVEAAGDPVPTYALLQSPVGMAIEPTTGLISWTPTVAQEGSHDVEVQASNSEGVDPQSYGIQVRRGTICPTDMAAYWKLDETGVFTYYDFYNGYDGRCGAGAQCPVPTTGYIDGGQAFNGSDTGIDVPTRAGDASFNWGVDDSFSIEFWVQAGTAACSGGNEVIVGRDDNPNSSMHWWVGCQDGGEAAFYLRDTGGTLSYTVGTTDLTNGAWHHIVAVRDASVDEIRVYVDSVPEGVASVAYSTGFDSSTAALNIGWLNRLGGYHFEGVVDEVALYDRALSQDEIDQHYEEGESSPGYCINPHIAVSKAVDPGVVYVEEWVTYTYTVTNPGDTPLSAVSLSDDMCMPISPPEGDSDGDNRLQPSETWTYLCSMTVSADITNTASVTATHLLGDIVTDADTAFVDVISPEIAIVKTANPTIIEAGDTVTYTYAVTNPGDDPLWNVNVADDKCGPVYFVDGDSNGNYACDPGEVWIYGCSTALTVDTTNVGVATAVDSIGNPVNGMDTASVHVGEPIQVYLPLILKQ